MITFTDLQTSVADRFQILEATIAQKFEPYCSFSSAHTISSKCWLSDMIKN